MSQQSIDAKTRELIGALSLGAPAAGNALSEWFRAFPESLYRVAAAGLSGKAELFVHSLMAWDGECCRHLCDPTFLDAPAAAKLARSLLLIEPRIDRWLAHAAFSWAADRDQKTLLRCLEILETMATRPRINSALFQLLKSVNGAARSKVVGIMARSSPTEGEIREWLGDPDPRTRANVLEAVAASDGKMEWTRQVLMDHLDDPNGRAAVNAAMGLYRMGMQESALAGLSRLALSRDPMVRCSAAWIMGEIPNIKLFDILNRLRTDPVGRVRWHALRSLSRQVRAGVKPKQAAVPLDAPPNSDAPPNIEEHPHTPEQTSGVEQPPAPPQPGSPDPDPTILNTRTFGRVL
jgi:hypothetical protein